MSNQLSKTGTFATLPDGAVDIYIVVGEGSSITVKRFGEAPRNIRTCGAHFVLFWPKDDHETRYHHSCCFLTKREAVAAAKKRVREWVAMTRDHAAAMIHSMGDSVW